MTDAVAFSDDGDHQPPPLLPVQSAAELNVNWATLMELLNSAATRTVLWQVADLMDHADLADDEVDALLKMPVPYRQTVTASLLSYADSIREGLRALDAQLLRLTGVS